MASHLGLFDADGDVKFFEKYDLSPDKNLSVICKPTFVTLQC